MRRRTFIAALVVAISAIICLALFLSFAPCQTLIPSFDSSSVQSAERNELSIRLQEYWQSGERPAAPLPPLPRVVKVDSIKGKWANIVLAGPMPDGELEGDYGSAWQTIYARHHSSGPLPCVFVHYVWSSGSINTDCCMAHFP